MLKSISFKLWATIAVTLIISMGSLLLLSRFSLHARFLSFSFQALEEQLNPLEESIADAYAEHGSLNIFKEDPRIWRRIVNRSLPFSKKLLKPEDFIDNQITEDRMFGRIQELRDFQLGQRHFVRSLGLYSADKQHIIGYNENSPDRLWREINLDGKRIAYLAFDRPHRVLRRSEAIFLEEQLKTFVAFFILVVIAAVVIASVASRWFVGPLNRLSEHARAVANGDFSVRIRYEASDEIGELCKNFDNMCSKLEHNEIARRQWVADISHEMRTPLAVLKAQIEAIEDGIRPPTAENISLLREKISALNHLINDLFELALSDVGALSLNPEALSLSGLIDDFVYDNSDRAEDANLDYEFDCHPNAVNARIFADRNRITQVLENLLENSVRYTDKPGKIRWSLRADGDMFRFEAADSAPGVSVSQRERIFDRLYRVERSRSRASGGAGLGLSLCKNLIEAQKGSISAAESDLGGLKIIIEFPRHQ